MESGMMMQQGAGVQAAPPPMPMGGGMMSRRTGKFNGDIRVGDKTVHVTDGVVDGSTQEHKVFVSADGQVVFNEKNQVLGSLDENNVLQKPTPEFIGKLKSLGLTQDAQP
jgi:hypothetical protein